MEIVIHTHRGSCEKKTNKVMTATQDDNRKIPFKGSFLFRSATRPHSVIWIRMRCLRHSNETPRWICCSSLLRRSRLENCLCSTWRTCWEKKYWGIGNISKSQCRKVDYFLLKYVIVHIIVNTTKMQNGTECLRRVIWIPHCNVVTAGVTKTTVS